MRDKIPRIIRTFAVPIILGWIAIIAVLNVVVPQLDEVGKMRSVSMAPDDAQSVVATKRMGAIFNEYKSNSSVMIVLEGQNPLGADAHAYYDQIVKKLDADTKHVEHVQDMWSDPLTGAGAQSNDGKAAYVQVYLAGNQGEALANESVESVQEHRQECARAQGGEGLRHRARGAVGGSAHGRRPQPATHHSGHVHRDHRDAAVGLSVDRHGVAHVGDGGASSCRPRAEWSLSWATTRSSGSPRSPRTCWSRWRSRPPPTMRSF